MIGLVSKHDLPHVALVDDNFLGSSDRGRFRAREIARLLVQSGVRLNWRFETRVTDVDESLFALFKHAGLERVSLGIESLNPRTLERFNKKITVDDVERALTILKSLGIDYALNFIMFEPDMTVEKLVEMTRTIRRLRLHWIPSAPHVLFANRLNLLGGTDVTRSLAAQGWTRESRLFWLSDEDNEILSRLGLILEAVPADRRYGVLERIQLPFAVNLGVVTTHLSRLRPRLKHIETSRDMPLATKRQAKSETGLTRGWLGPDSARRAGRGDRVGVEPRRLSRERDPGDPESAVRHRPVQPGLSGSGRKHVPGRGQSVPG